MATHSIHNPDSGIGFDMRNAHLYHDSDDSDDEIDPRYKPRPYTPNNDSDCGCCYILLVLIILIVGSVIGYSIGSTFTAPQAFEPITNAPKPTINTNKIYPTPSPTRKDPFHNHKKGQKGGITSMFRSETTFKPALEPPAIEKRVFEPSAIEKPAFEPSSIEKPAFEPSAIKKPAFEPSAIEKPAFEPSAIKKPAFELSAIKKPPFEPSAIEKPVFEAVDDVSFDITNIKKTLNSKKYDVDLNYKTLQLGEHDIGDSAILSTIVLDGYHIAHVFSHSQQFNVQYPASNRDYDVNQYRRWCFYFYLYQYPAAQIDVTFHSFQLERGFDRVLIRHFNQSFVDPPLVIAGRGAFDEAKYPWIMPETVTYHLRENEFKTICVEMETDDSVGLSGVNFDVDIKYDDCRWSEYTECSIPDESKKHWDRGPWYDGTCGIGVRQRQRTTNTTANHVEGFVDCVDSDHPDIDIDGPWYCLKAACEKVDTVSIPSNIRYGWANHSTFYNGIGTLDAKYPDLLRILTAHPSTPTSFDTINEIKQYLLSETLVALYQSYPLYHVHPIEHKFDLDSMINALENKKKEILSEHTDERVLTLPVLNIKHKKKTMEWLGARLTHSLLIGRTFTMIFTGSSNTAGHDNQFSSTYPMQLQSRLRTLWSTIGVDGAAMNIRNEAVGGTPKTDTMAWHIHARSSETVAYPYNKGNGNGNGFWRNEDVIFWESFMNDGGRPPLCASEEQLRSTALLNAIWGGMNSIDSIEEDKCLAKDFKKLRPPRHLTKDNLFQSFTDIYGKHMGLIEMDFATFIGAVCAKAKYKTLKINWHPNAAGHRCEADIYAYMLLDAAIQFMKSNKEMIMKKQKDENVHVLDEWLLDESGNWGIKYIESITQKDNTLFPEPKYCRPFCTKTIAPFALKTVEPNEWDIGFRLSDYLVYDYDKMDNISSYTGTSDVGPDIKSIFSVQKLLQWNGWNYYQKERDPPHYPQDRTGKIGSMDRKPSISIKKGVWEQRFKQFLRDKHAQDVDVISDEANPRQMYSKYFEEWAQYVLHNDYDVKIAFLVPEIGNHSILAFTGEGGRNFYEIDHKNSLRQMAINIERMKSNRKHKVNKEYDYKYDFSKRLTAQRDCIIYQRGCVFHNIPPGKYIMRYYPINMTHVLDGGASLVQIIAF